MKKKLLFLAAAVLTAVSLTAPLAEASVTCTLRCLCGVITCTCSDGSTCEIPDPPPPMACIWLPSCEGGDLEL